MICIKAEYYKVKREQNLISTRSPTLENITVIIKTGEITKENIETSPK